MANENNLSNENKTGLSVIINILDTITGKNIETSQKNKTKEENSNIQSFSSNETNEKLVDECRKDVLKNLNKIYNQHPRPKYVWGAKGPNYYDCSGFSQTVYKNAGLNIPRVSEDQSNFTGKTLKKSELKPGDLVFYGKGKVSHVAIYMGNGKIMESGGGGPKNNSPSRAGKGVRIRSIDARKDFQGGVSLEDVMKKNKVIDKTNENQIVQNNETIFEDIFKYLLDVEGGYSNDKNDSGGKTMYGITENEAREHGYKGDMKNLSKDFAKQIYKEDYYQKHQLDKVTDDRIALSICDFSVNAGANGIKKAQQTLNKIDGANLEVDGILGPKTLEALNKTDPENFLKEYHNSQRNYYESISHGKNKVFLKGWQNRVDKKENTIKNMNNHQKKTQSQSLVR